MTPYVSSIQQRLLKLNKTFFDSGKKLNIRESAFVVLEQKEEFPLVKRLHMVSPIHTELRFHTFPLQ